MRIGKGTFLLFFAIVRCRAQQDSASIPGVVSDSSGGVVPRASVEIRNQADGQAVNLVMDGSDNFFRSGAAGGNLPGYGIGGGIQKQKFTRTTCCVSPTACG